jgi:hypothetical protein
VLFANWHPVARRSTACSDPYAAIGLDENVLASKDGPIVQRE